MRPVLLDVTHRPTSPLPWRVAGGLTAGYALVCHTQPTPSGGVTVAETNFAKPRDARYIAHACNAYPRLVAALIGCQLTAEATALLRELGEIS